MSVWSGRVGVGLGTGSRHAAGSPAGQGEAARMNELDPARAVSSGAALPPDAERLLVALLVEGFTAYCCGPKVAPRALLAAYAWPRWVDLVTIRDFDRITAARVPRRGTVDIFAPEVMVWAYEGPPQQVLPALLELVHPAHPDAPAVEVPASRGLWIPRAEQRPMSIRLPSALHAGTRARRLAGGARLPGGAAAGVAELLGAVEALVSSS